MFVSEIMSKCVAECTEDAGLAEVFDLICKCEHGLVVVIDSHAHRVPIGVVSDRSICEQIIARGRNPRNLIAGSVIDSRIRTVVETDLVEGLDFSENAVSALVVTDRNRQVCGLVPIATLRAVRRTANSAVSPSRSPQEDAKSASQTNGAIAAFGWVQ